MDKLEDVVSNLIGSVVDPITNFLKIFVDARLLVILLGLAIVIFAFYKSYKRAEEGYSHG